MSEVTTSLRNRFGDKQDRVSSTEEALIEKLDAFLTSIEHRLEKFEQYFQVMGDGADEVVDYGKDASSRRNSTASLSSIRSYSAYNLNKVQEQLLKVKDQVLRTSFTNLDYLYKTLDDTYNYLFSVDENTTPVPDCGTSREILSTNIINTIQFLENKLNHIDQLVKSKTPQATANYDKDDKFKRFRFFNFNKALKDAEQGLLHYYQLPLSWRENRYIVFGYRFTLDHSSMCSSMFHFNHNEAGNIWTHMFGALTILYLGLIHFPTTAVFAANTWIDNTIMYMFLAAALECFACSVLWHTYSGFANLGIRSRFACIDYTGITVLITSSVISVEYCALAPYPKLLAFFVGFSLLSGVGLLLFNWSPYFDKPDCRPLRIGFFVSLALLGFLTCLFKGYYEGFGVALWFYGPIGYYSLIWYWIGVIFYGGLIPERWRYDVIINEDDTCRHTHTSTDVLTGHIENAGQEEFEELEHELDEKDKCDGVLDNADTNHQTDSTSEIIEHDEHRYDDILAKHFPKEPVKTPYHRDFMSLWWVDYIANSHNIWHVFVVLGALGHYVTLVGMFESIARN